MMDILWAMTYFTAAAAVHAIFVRLPLKGDSVSKFVLVGGAFGVGLALHVLISFASPLLGIAALVGYAFACELYLFLFTLVGTSVSVRILLTLRDRAMTPDEIHALYANDNMVNGRIARLRSVGLLKPDDCPSPRGRRLVAAFLALKRFFGHPLPALPLKNASASRFEPKRQLSGIA